MRILPQTRKGWFRALIPTLALVFVVAYFFLIPFVRYCRYAPEGGDVVFQSMPKTALVEAIETATGSAYSHCGVVVRENGKWIVIEALGEVRKTPLLTWILRGRGGRFAAYRLKEPWRRHIPQFVQELDPFLGRPYDSRFRMEDRFIYCSELVYKAYRNATGDELGVLVKFGDLDWMPIKSTIREYEGGPPPLDRMMITPRHLSEAEQLEKAFGGSF